MSEDILKKINSLEEILKLHRESKDVPDKVTKSYKFDISKSDDDKQIAFGWAMISKDAEGNTVTDLQEDQIDPEDLEDLAYNYVRFHRDVGQLHETKGEGCVVESMVFTLDKQRYLGIPEGTLPIGWWLGLYINDEEVWAKVKDGTYGAFSIEGTATRVEVEDEDGD